MESCARPTAWRSPAQPCRSPNLRAAKHGSLGAMRAAASVCRECRRAITEPKLCSLDLSPPRRSSISGHKEHRRSSYRSRFPRSRPLSSRRKHRLRRQRCRVRRRRHRLQPQRPAAQPQPARPPSTGASPAQASGTNQTRTGGAGRGGYGGTGGRGGSGGQGGQGPAGGAPGQGRGGFQQLAACRYNQAARRRGQPLGIWARSRPLRPPKRPRSARHPLPMRS